MRTQLILYFLFMLSISTLVLAWKVKTPQLVEEKPTDYEASLKRKSDDHSTYGWTFSHGRPYHYFSSTKDIPQSFLPVKHNAIPERDGVWVLRHKDFEGPSRIFRTEGDTTGLLSSISYSSKSQLFQWVTVKALVYGEPEVILDFNKLGHMQQAHKISLLQQGNENCTNSNNSNATNQELHWISYEMNTTLTGSISLEVVIHHPESFVILDEIVVHHEPFGVKRTTYDKTSGGGGSSLKSHSTNNTLLTKAKVNSTETQGFKAPARNVSVKCIILP